MDFLTVAEVADRLRLSAGHVRLLLKRGTLRGEKVRGPGRWLNAPWQVELSELEAALAEGRIVVGRGRGRPRTKAKARPFKAGAGAKRIGK